jgi:hypothetical protein
MACEAGDEANNGNTGGKVDRLSDTRGSIPGDGLSLDGADGFNGVGSDSLTLDGVEQEDPFAAAKDVHLPLVVFDENVAAPSYKYASVTTGFSLGGTEFWQKWPGGENPTYQYSEGSEAGKRCMYASARRFEAIMNDPPESILTLRQISKWHGSFFNWNDDYSHESAWGDGSSARLWAWRTGLIKWISQTNKDGSCFLPTYTMVEALAADCLAEAESSDGEIQGCRAP